MFPAAARAARVRQTLSRRVARPRPLSDQRSDECVALRPVVSHAPHWPAPAGRGEAVPGARCRHRSGAHARVDRQRRRAPARCAGRAERSAARDRRKPTRGWSDRGHCAVAGFAHDPDLPSLEFDPAGPRGSQCAPGPRDRAAHREAPAVHGSRGRGCRRDRPGAAVHARRRIVGVPAGCDRGRRAGDGCHAPICSAGAAGGGSRTADDVPRAHRGGASRNHRRKSRARRRYPAPNGTRCIRSAGNSRARAPSAPDGNPPTTSCHTPR